MPDPGLKISPKTRNARNRWWFLPALLLGAGLLALALVAILRRGPGPEQGVRSAAREVGEMARPQPEQPNPDGAGPEAGVAFPADGSRELASAGPSQPRDEAQARVEALRAEAGSLAQSGDLAGAIGRLDQALRLAPGDELLLREQSHLCALQGWKEYERRDFKKARGFFEESLHYWPQSPEALRGLGFAHYQLRERKEAEERLLSYIEVGGDRPEVYALLGQLCYESDRPSEALYFFRLSLMLDPEQPGLSEKAQKIAREVKVEAEFERSETSHFLLKYEGVKLPEVWRVVEVICEEAYLVVGKDLGIYPVEPVVVILYTDRQFQDVTRSPAWAGAIFDGRIRIPAKGLTQRTEVLERIVFHEYTHAVVHDYTSGRAPVWLHEGLAQKVEGFTYDTGLAARRLLGGGGPISFSRLEGNFISLPKPQAELAYMQSRLAIEYLEDAYGPFVLRELLRHLHLGSEMGPAVLAVTSDSYLDLDRGFSRWIEKKSQ